MKNFRVVFQALAGIGLLFILAACTSTEVYVFDKDPRILSGKWGAQLFGQPHLNETYIVAISPDNSLLATSHLPNKLNIHNTTTGTLVKTVAFPVTQVAFQSNQVLVGTMIGPSHTIGFFNIETGQLDTFESPQTANGDFLTRDGKKMFWMESGKIAGLNLETRQPLVAINPFQKPGYQQVTFSSLGNWFAVPGIHSEKVEVWSVAGKKLQVPTSGQGLTQVVFSSDEKKLIINEDCLITVWDIASGKQDSRFSGLNCSDMINSPVRFAGLTSHDGSLIAILTQEYEKNDLIRYRLRWIRGNQIEQTVELPLRSPSAFRRYLFYPNTLNAIGPDILLSYEGTFGRLASKDYVWRNDEVSSTLTLNLTTKYVDQKTYTIGGTAQMGNQIFTVQGEGYARNSKIVVRTSTPQPPLLQFRLKLLDNNEIKWSLAGQTEAHSTLARYAVGAAQEDKTIELYPNSFSSSYLLEQPFMASLERQQ